jgi:hypothetical protein
MAEVLEELDKHRPDHREYEGGWWELACAGCDFAKGQRLSHLDWAPYRLHRAEVFAAALSDAGFGPVKAAQAEALRDAADDFGATYHGNWLRARADAIGVGK